MSTKLDIGFLNNCLVQWNVDANQQMSGFGIDEVSWPDAPLKAQGGGASCSYQEDASKIGAGTPGGEYFFFCWNDGQWRFGVKIVVNIQVLDMGDRPSWEVMWDQNVNSGNEDISWQSSGSDPADQFSWPSDIGYDIVATPTSSHQGLSIKVVITDMPKK